MSQRLPSDFAAYYKYRRGGIPPLQNLGVSPQFEDGFSEAYTGEELFRGCFADCVPQYRRGETPSGTKGLLICCGADCGDDLLGSSGIVVQALRRATLHGELNVTALDICDGVGYDFFGNGGKVKITEKSMSGVTSRVVEGKSHLGDLQDLVLPIHSRWGSVCGGLLIDIRGAISLQIVALRSEQTSVFYRRICGISDDGEQDTLSILTSRALRKGVVRLLRYFPDVDPLATRNCEQLLAEIRVSRMKFCSDTRLLTHLVAHHETTGYRLARERGMRDVALAPMVIEMESLIEEMTTAAKRIKKTRVHLEGVRERLAETAPVRAAVGLDLPPLPQPIEPSEQEVRIGDANHQVVSDFYTHFVNTSPLHFDVVNLCRESNAIIGRILARKAGRIELNPITPAVMGVIDDIVSFVCERAALIGEGIVGRDESFAWFDIEGCSRRLRSSDSWAQPLWLAMATTYPRVKVEFPNQTTLGSDDEAEERSGGSEKSPAEVSGAKPPASTKVSQSSTGDGKGVAALGPTASSASEVASIDPTRRKLSITKKHDTEEADKKYLMAVYDSQTLVQDVTKYLKAGTVMVKHGRIGSAHGRLFWVASVANKMTLLWVDPEKRSTSAKANIPLTEVASVVLGPFSKVFKRHPVTNDHKDFFLSFTLTLRGDSRTVDIVAPTLPDFEAWVLGISHMAYVDPFYGKRLTLPNDTHSSRLNEQERTLCEAWYIFPQHYVAVKDKIVDLREEVRQHLRLFGNNAEQAFVALGGIHLPQVNAKGAILMTKGELRHHCSSFNIDIFRVCEMWKVFSSQDLIYDPAFVPATNFGVTNRKVPYSGK